MRWVLDAQEQATTERAGAVARAGAALARRRRAAGPACGAATHASASSGSASARSSALADLLAPTQQLVRPLLVVVPGQPVAGRTLSHAVLRRDRRRRGLDQRALLHHRLATASPSRARCSSGASSGTPKPPRAGDTVRRTAARPRPASCRPRCRRWPRTPTARADGARADPDRRSGFPSCWPTTPASVPVPSCGCRSARLGRRRRARCSLQAAPGRHRSRTCSTQDDRHAARRRASEDDKPDHVGVAAGVGAVRRRRAARRSSLVLAGRWALLAERERWAEGRYLAVDLQLVCERNDDQARRRDRPRR